MSVQWDATGQFIVGEGCNDRPYLNEMMGAWDDPSNVTAIPAAAFTGGQVTQRSMMHSHTGFMDPGDGSEPVPIAFTVVSTWVGQLFFAGDQVQAILDLLANPPTPPPA